MPQHHQRTRINVNALSNNSYWPSMPCTYIINQLVLTCPGHVHHQRTRIAVINAQVPSNQTYWRHQSTYWRAQTMYINQITRFNIINAFQMYHHTTRIDVTRECTLSDDMNWRYLSIYIISQLICYYGVNQRNEWSQPQYWPNLIWLIDITNAYLKFHFEYWPLPRILDCLQDFAPQTQDDPGTDNNNRNDTLNYLNNTIE